MQREEELAKTRKRLRTVYSLLGGALLALVAAGYFYLNANSQKKIAQEQTKTADTERRKADSAKARADSSLKNFLVAQAAKQELEFKNLLSRARVILDANGYPDDILKEMKSILSSHTHADENEKREWQNEIASIENGMKNNK
jgi:hypothetical protein